MEESLRRTPLYETHLKLGARMVAFGGWDMPIQYDGILAEHEAVRQRAGIFDVSHMGELDLIGPGALAAVQQVTTADASKLAIGRAHYTVICHEHGGIVDDCIVYRLGPEHYRIVLNAANIEKDVEHVRKHTGDLCTLEDRSSEFGLLAVQGPSAATILDALTAEPISPLPSFSVADTHLAGVPITAARTGYTGEDGFELFVPANETAAVWDAITAVGVKPIGLGARDTLRLEARLTLYGNDIDDTTNPYEAGLGFTVKLEKGEFIGRDALRRVAQGGPTRRLVGFKVKTRGIVRAGTDVLDEEENAVVGHVTSGGPAPTVGGAIGMAYIPVSMAQAGEVLRLRQRGKILDAVQVKGPFYRRQERA